MAGGGSQSAANSTLKNNRNSLPSKIRGGFKSYFEGKVLPKKKIKEVDVSPEELANIKAKIRVKAKRQRKRIATVFIITAVILSIASIWIYVSIEQMH